MSKWENERIKNVNIGSLSAVYKVTPVSYAEKQAFKTNPEIFEFEALSIGNNAGQMCIIPLDDSSKENAEYIVEALKYYAGRSKDGK